jgi:hypothetical protein
MKQNKAYLLVPVADTNGQCSDFSSYVASINNDQVIAFQATLKNGVSGIFASKSDQTASEMMNTSVPQDLCACCAWAWADMRKDILTVERGFASLSESSETPVVSGEQIPHQAASVATSSGS